MRLVANTSRKTCVLFRVTCPLASSPASHHPQPDMLRPHSLKESKINAIIVAAVLLQLGFEICSRSKYTVGQSCQPWEALNGSGFDILRSKPAYDSNCTNDSCPLSVDLLVSPPASTNDQVIQWEKTIETKHHRGPNDTVPTVTHASCGR